MTRRGCILALSLGLWASSQPGCVSPSIDRTPPTYPGNGGSAKDANSDNHLDYPVTAVGRKHPGFTESEVLAKEAPIKQVSAADKTSEEERMPASDLLPTKHDSPPESPIQSFQRDLPPSNSPPSINLTPPPVLEPRPANPPIVDALLCVRDKRLAEAVKHLEKYDKANQDMLIRILALAVRLTEDPLDKAKPQEKAMMMEQLRGMITDLGPQAALVIDKMLYCRDINRFGVFNPLPEDHVFQAGSEGRAGEEVKIYVELKNFHSQPQGEFYVTRLTSSMKISDDKGVVWERKFPSHDESEREPSDRSRTLRQDYFIFYCFHVPPGLPQGNYTLSLEITDALSQPHRSVKRTLPFPVLATTCVRGCQCDENATLLYNH